MKYFLNYIFGCRGKEKHKLKQLMMQMISMSDKNELHPYGLSDDEIQFLAKQFEFTTLAKYCPQRGNENQLKQIAWFGSAIADISIENKNQERKKILTEAALFNLGICLFDSIIDDAPNKRKILLSIINLKTIKQKLLSPQFFFFEQSQDNHITLIANIFDTVFGSIGQRQCKIDEFYVMIARMYESEIETSEEIFSAKYLPVVFIGRLGQKEVNYYYHSYFSRLAEFLFIYDDWLDLADDALHLKTNYFLTGKHHQFKFLKIFQIIKQIVLFKKFRKIRQTIFEKKLHEVLSASAYLSESAHYKHSLLLNKIFA